MKKAMRPLRILLGGTYPGPPGSYISRRFEDLHDEQVPADEYDARWKEAYDRLNERSVWVAAYVRNFGELPSAKEIDEGVLAWREAGAIVL